MNRIVLTSLAALLAAGPALAETEVEVFHAWPSHKRFHEPIAEAFMAENPDIRIVFRTPAPTYDDGHQAVLRAAITRDLPDIYLSGYHLLPPLARTLEARDQIVPLDDLLAEEGAEFVAENYADNILSLGKVDGTLYGMPFNASTPIVYYNADLVREAGGDPENLPETWDELIDLAGRIDALGDDIDGLSYDVHDWPDDWLWQALVFQQGGEIMNAEETAVAFDGELGLEGLRLAKRIADEAGMPMIGFGESRTQFCSGTKGIQFSSTAGVRRFSDCSEGNFELVTGRFPILDKENGMVPTGGNAAVILAEDAPTVLAAWEYVKFMAGPKGQEIAVLGSGYMPTNLRAVEPEFLGTHYEENPNWTTSLEQLPVAKAWYGYPGTNGVKIWRTQRDIITMVMQGTITPEEGLERMVAETEALLPKE